MRKIIHIDMDCFFAAVEMRDNPSLRDIPIAIGGARAERGVISTCNYPARAFGVRSAMPTGQALKLCPQLTLLPGHMEKYRQVSQQLRAIFYRYTELVEPLSLDEAYLDVSHSPHCHGSATYIAEQIRADIANELQLTASAGVAPNKFIAKIASDWHKPNGIKVITPEQVPEFVQQLPLRKIPGVGAKTAERLARLGLHQCADILNTDLAALIREFGSFAETLLQRAQGIDERPVEPSRERKSVAVEHTFNQDLQCLADSEAPLLELHQKLQLRLERAKARDHIQKIGVKLKFQDFQQTTIERQHPELSLPLLQQLLQQAWQRGDGKTVRLLGIHVGLKAQEKQAQLGFDWTE